jgi:hypothetical protein
VNPVPGSLFPPRKEECIYGHNALISPPIITIFLHALHSFAFARCLRVCALHHVCTLYNHLYKAKSSFKQFVIRSNAEEAVCSRIITVIFGQYNQSVAKKKELLALLSLFLSLFYLSLLSLFLSLFSSSSDSKKGSQYRLHQTCTL